MLDAITIEVSCLADRVTAYRFVRLIETGELTMPLEIKGLRGKALKAAANLDRLNQAYDAFNEAAPAHAADVEGLTPQITALQDDLQFATQVLGNSVNGSGTPAEKPKQEPVIVPTQTPAPPVVSPEVAQAIVQAAQGNLGKFDRMG